MENLISLSISIRYTKCKTQYLQNKKEISKKCSNSYEKPQVGLRENIHNLLFCYVFPFLSTGIISYTLALSRSVALEVFCNHFNSINYARPNKVIVQKSNT